MARSGARWLEASSGTCEREWRAFLERTLAKLQAPGERNAYSALMKWGLSPYSWHEFIFQAYVGHAREVIHLTGLPDVQGSRPHDSPARAQQPVGPCSRG